MRRLPALRDAENRVGAFLRTVSLIESGRKKVSTGSLAPDGGSTGATASRGRARSAVPYRS